MVSSQKTLVVLFYTLYIVPSSTVDWQPDFKRISCNSSCVTMVTDTADLPKADLVISDITKKSILSWTSQLMLHTLVVRYSLDSTETVMVTPITINETTLGTGSGNQNLYDTNLKVAKIVYTMYASKTAESPIITNNNSLKEFKPIIQRRKHCIRFNNRNLGESSKQLLLLNKSRFNCNHNYR